MFPIYDGHGNMIYTLTREANDGHDLGNERIYGAWGDLRQDSNPGDGPNTQYVGNLGHKKDNESGLTYMRARYYEPGTGRFISEDPARDGINWFVYCGNDPLNRADFNGKKWLPIAIVLMGLLAGYLGVIGSLPPWFNLSDAANAFITWVSSALTALTLAVGSLEISDYIKSARVTAYVYLGSAVLLGLLVISTHYQLTLWYELLDSEEWPIIVKRNTYDDD